MELNLLLTFFVSSLLLAVAPGPDNIFVLTQSAMYGAKSGLLVVCGLCTGILLHTSLVVLGISAAIVANYYLFLTIKIAGALYLLYLAKMCLFTKASAINLGQTNSLSAKKLYLRGLIMNATNPKVIIFFLAFFPQFIKDSSSSYAVAMQMLIQGLLFLLASFIVFSLFAILASYLTNMLKSVRVNNIINKVSGIIFIVLAISALFFSN